MHSFEIGRSTMLVFLYSASFCTTCVYSHFGSRLRCAAGRAARRSSELSTSGAACPAERSADSRHLAVRGASFAAPLRHRSRAPWARRGRRRSYQRGNRRSRPRRTSRGSKAAEKGPRWRRGPRGSAQRAKPKRAPKPESGFLPETRRRRRRRSDSRRLRPPNYV